MVEKIKTNYNDDRKELAINEVKAFLENNFLSLVWFDWDLQNYYANKLVNLFWVNYDSGKIRNLLSNLEQKVDNAVDIFLKEKYLDEIWNKLWYKKICVRDATRSKDVYLSYPIFYKIHFKRKLAKYIMENWLYNFSRLKIYVSNYGTYWVGSEPYKYEVLSVGFGKKWEYKIVV